MIVTRKKLNKRNFCLLESRMMGNYHVRITRGKNPRGSAYPSGPIIFRPFIKKLQNWDRISHLIKY